MQRTTSKKSGITSSEAPSDNESDGSHPLYSLNETYSSSLVVINAQKLKITEFAVRRTDRSHPSIAVWMRKFAKGGYGAGNAYISVAILDMRAEYFTELLKYVSGYSDLNLHCLPKSLNRQVHRCIAESGVVYVDGMHRGVALCDDTVVAAMLKSGYKVKAHLYYRRDLIPMSENDVVAIGGALNAQDSLSIKMSLGDRCHNANATLFALLKANPGHFPKGKKAPYNNAVQQLARDVHMIQRSPFRSIMDEHNVNCDIIGRRQRSRYDKIMRGVFRYSTNKTRALRLEKAVNTASIQLWSIGNVWEKNTFSEQLFVLYTLPELFPTSRYGNKKSPRQSLSQTSPISAPVISVENVNTVVEFVVTIWGNIYSNVIQVLGLDEEIIFNETSSQPGTVMPVLEKVNNLLVKFSTAKIIDGKEVEKSEFVSEIVQAVKLLVSPHSFQDGNDSQERNTEIQSEQTPIQLDFTATGVTNSNFAHAETVSIRRNSDAHPNNSITENDTDNTVQGKSHSIVQQKENIASLRLVARSPENGSESEFGESKTLMDDSADAESIRRADESNNTSTKEPIVHKEKIVSQSADEPVNCTQEWAAVKSALIANNQSDLVYLNAMKEIWDNSTVELPALVSRLETGEEPDCNGFSIIYRNESLISWKLPKARVCGFTDVTEEETIVPETLVQKSGKWLEGFVNVLGYYRTKFRLFEDRERTFSRLNPQFHLATSLSRRSKEYILVFLPLLHTLGDEMEQLDLEGIHIQRILRALGFRPPHRIFFLPFSVMDYFNVRGQLFHGIVANNPGWFRAVKLICDKEDSVLPSAVREVLKESMNNYFRSCRLQLDAAGFVVLNQIFIGREHTQPNNWITRPEDSSPANLQRKISQLFRYWATKTPTEAQVQDKTLTEEHFKLWSSIRDTNNPNEMGIGKSSRLMSTTYGVTTHLENLAEAGGENQSILEARCHLEVAVMQIVHCLRLSFTQWGHDACTSEKIHLHTEKHSLSTPDTGGRILANMGRHTRRQKGHLDFIFPKEAVQCEQLRTIKYVPYFIIVTGKDTTPIWLSEGSHKLISVTETQMRELGKHVTLSLFQIPPWSLLIVRGDLIHAGAGGAESTGNNCHRFHMYVLRQGVALGDTINHFVAQHMKPNRQDERDLRGRARVF